jgi:hypothetical protein
VSYVWHLAGDALADLRELDPSLQEDVLDEVETVAGAPSRRRVDPQGYAIHDFERTKSDVRPVVFIRVHRDDLRQTISVLGIPDYWRPHPPLAQKKSDVHAMVDARLRAFAPPRVAQRKLSLTASAIPNEPKLLLQSSDATPRPAA